MTVTATPATSTPELRWSRVSDSLSSGEWHGNYAGMIEHVGDRYIATDAFGGVAGRFRTEEAARAALQPDALEAAHAEREAREQRVAIATAMLAACSAIIAAAGMLTLASL
ncbi:MAG: hypothetical protein JWR33_1391 [Naasia sp.]|jgi:hypothetical protein|uniref:hypothetical protein n=1 Tax=Naasia sp. TaxID=2546198 RepID=UPI0026134D2F|nr:hypothetical protein [Naasia sp.]MCU1570650.1 hypothetical protein [Naasia sp.]